MNNYEILKKMNEEQLCDQLTKIYLAIPHGISYEDVYRLMMEMLLDNGNGN